MVQNILHIDSSPLGEQSISRKWTAKCVNALQEKYPSAKVVVYDFGVNPLPHLSAEALHAAFTPEAQRSPEQKSTLTHVDEMVNTFLAADLIVIGAPMWNLNIPSSLKAWIDHIVQAGKTFKYTEQGAIGLVDPAKKIIVVSSRGGVYTEGPTVGYDFQEPYLKAIFGFLGIQEIHIIRAEGVARGEAALAKATEEAAAQLDQVIGLV
jgi:FMN-dependent NADH-azoreductase